MTEPETDGTAGGFWVALLLYSETSLPGSFPVMLPGLEAAKLLVLISQKNCSGSDSPVT